MVIDNISACGQHRLIKVVLKKSLTIALLFISNICKLAHLHIHEYSLLLVFGKNPSKIGKYISFRFVCFLFSKYFGKLSLISSK